jgi:hypothetical protein
MLNSTIVKYESCTSFPFDRRAHLSMIGRAAPWHRHEHREHRCHLVKIAGTSSQSVEDQVGQGPNLKAFLSHKKRYPYSTGECRQAPPLDKHWLPVR